MAVPRNRHSTARKNSKRSHSAKRVIHLASCSNCQAVRRPHTACTSCGYYKGQKAVEV